MTRACSLLALTVLFGLAGVASAQTVPTASCLGNTPTLQAGAAPQDTVNEAWAQIFAKPGENGISTVPEPRPASCTSPVCKSPCSTECRNAGCVAVCLSLATCECGCACP